eukprot:2268992-Lingulodinium_polyedra.AAC.1
MKSKLFKFASRSCQGEVQVCNEWIQAMMLGRPPGMSVTNSFLATTRTRLQYLCKEEAPDGTINCGKEAVLLKLEKVQKLPQQEPLA